MEATPLLEAMTDRVRRERETLLAQARAEAEHVQQAAHQTGEDRTARTRTALDAELARAEDQTRRRAQAEARITVKTTKDTVVDEVLAEVKSRLADLAAQPQFAEMLPLLLGEVLESAAPDVEVHVPPAHEERCRQWVQDHGGGRRVVADSALRDGVAIQDAGPTYRITNTLSARLAKRTESLRRHCLNRLFADGRGGA